MSFAIQSTQGQIRVLGRPAKINLAPLKQAGENRVPSQDAIIRVMTHSPCACTVLLCTHLKVLSFLMLTRDYM